MARVRWCPHVRHPRRHSRARSGSGGAAAAPTALSSARHARAGKCTKQPAQRRVAVPGWHAVAPVLSGLRSARCRQESRRNCGHTVVRGRERSDTEHAQTEEFPPELLEKRCAVTACLTDASEAARACGPRSGTGVRAPPPPAFSRSRSPRSTCRLIELVGHVSVGAHRSRPRRAVSRTLKRKSEDRSSSSLRSCSRFFAPAGNSPSMHRPSRIPPDTGRVLLAPRSAHLDVNTPTPLRPFRCPPVPRRDRVTAAAEALTRAWRR